MENMLGLLRIHVHRGINLAIRDVVTSDPYLIIKMGSQKVKTRVVNNNINPEWNEELTLSITDPNLSVILQVYDKDTFSPDDRMGEAEIEIRPFLEAVKTMQMRNVEEHTIPSGTIITKLKPKRDNCLAEESAITFQDGSKIVQHMFLRLRNVESGEVELHLEWIHLPGSRGL